MERRDLCIKFLLATAETEDDGITMDAYLPTHPPGRASNTRGYEFHGT